MNRERANSDRAAARLGSIATVILLVSVPGSSGAQEDLDYQAEHLIESAMNYRLAGFPTTGDGFASKRSNSALTLGGGYSSSAAFDLQGTMLGAAFGRRLGRRSGVELAGFFDRFDVSGPGGEQILHPLWSRSIPLAFPQKATVSNPDGRVNHWGAGVAWLWEPGSPVERRRWLWRFGLFYSEVKVSGFEADYRLVADPSVEGVIDYDQSYGFAWPWIDVEKHFDLGGRWAMAPHAGFFFPLPAQGFAGRMTGPGFDVSGDTESASDIAHMGDPHLALGWRFDHRPSALSVDLGATAFTALAEGLEHPGVDTALVIQLVWRR